mgnify:CR=1 FL=1
MKLNRSAYWIIFSEENAQRIAEEEAANTPEGKLAQKLKKKQQDEKESLELAMDMMGISSPVPSGSGIDAMVPDSKDDFEKLQKAISEKVQSLSGSRHDNDFVEDIIKDLSLDRKFSNLKRFQIFGQFFSCNKSNFYLLILIFGV